MVSLQDIIAARARIAPHIYQTPLIRVENLDEALGCQVYIKAESMQKTNAFKLRGAMNKLLSLSPEQLKNGVVAASSGNHGKGVAYAAKLLGAPCTIVLPNSAPEIKKQGIRDLGASVEECPIEERFSVVNRLSSEYGYTPIPPFDDSAIIAGQGTIGLEILEQMPTPDAVVVPVGGGGLISGIATAVREQHPDVKIYGSEPSLLGRYFKSRAAGKPIAVAQAKSIADALLTTQPGQANFPIAMRYVDDFLQVEEQSICAGARLLLESGKLFCEPSSGIVLGAALQGILPVKPTDKVCFIISAGNASLEQISSL